MKKLMCVMVVAALMGSAYAASFDWKFTANNSYVGDTVYVLLSAPATGASVSDITGAAVGSAAVAQVGSGARAQYYANGSGTSATINSGDSVSFYYVVIAEKDGKDYYWTSGAQSATAYAPPSSGSTSSLNASSSLGTVGGTGWTQASGGSSGDVPEPTSGLLLLVGAGMLALRRKQK